MTFIEGKKEGNGYNSILGNLGPREQGKNADVLFNFRKLEDSMWKKNGG